MTQTQTNENRGSGFTLAELFPSLVQFRVEAVTATPATVTETRIALTQRQRYDRILLADALDVGAAVLASSFNPHRVQATDKDGQLVFEDEKPKMRWPTPSEIIQQAADYKAKCRRQVVDRLIWDPNDSESPYVQAVSWGAQPKGEDFEIVGEAYIPKLGKTRVRPIATVEIPYLVQEDDLWVTNGVDRCIFLRPTKEGNAHTAISLRLCREVLIRNLMAILDAAGQREAFFDALPNKIRVPGAYKTTFIPSHLEDAKGGEHWAGYKFIGKYWGKVVLLHRKSQQGLKIGKEYVFRVVSETESVIVLFLLGMSGGVEVDDQEFTLSIKAGLDPALVLEMDVKKINRHNIMKEVKDQWEEIAFDELPGLAYLYESGLLKPEDSEETRISLVHDERTRAAKQIKQQLDEAFEQLMRVHFGQLPPLAALLGEVEYEAMLEADAGDDPVTALITERVGEFSWEMPICVELRQEILKAAKANPEGSAAPVTAASEVVESGEPAAQTTPPVEEHPAPPSTAPNTEALRPEVAFKVKISGAWVSIDAYTLLGIKSEKAADVIAELRVVEPDLTAVALALEPGLTAKSKAALDPVKDEKKLAKLIAEAKKKTAAACEKVVTGG